MFFGFNFPKFEAFSNEIIGDTTTFPNHLFISDVKHGHFFSLKYFFRKSKTKKSLWSPVCFEVTQRRIETEEKGFLRSPN